MWEAGWVVLESLPPQTQPHWHCCHHSPHSAPLLEAGNQACWGQSIIPVTRDCTTTNLTLLHSSDHWWTEHHAGYQGPYNYKPHTASCYRVWGKEHHTCYWGQYNYKHHTITRSEQQCIILVTGDSAILQQNITMLQSLRNKASHWLHWFPPWFDHSWLSQHPLLWFCLELWIHSWLKNVHEEAPLPNCLFRA